MPRTSMILGIGWMVSLSILSGCTRPAAPTTSAASPPSTPQFASTPFIMPPVQNPRLEDAATMALADDAEVIGVVVNGQARAYSVKALSTISGHIINDVVGQRPLTMTFCDRDQCVRAFTSSADTPAAPLALRVGGFEKGLLIYDGEEFYRQSDGQSTIPGSTRSLPHATVPTERTTWKEWKVKHPTSAVFIGNKK